MDNTSRIQAFAQSVYQARHNQQNDATDDDLTSFLTETIEWTNQLIPEIENARDEMKKPVDWNFVRTNDDPSLGTVPSNATISYQVPSNIRKLVINAHRDLTIQQDGTIISSFKLVNPNQLSDPTDTFDIGRDRATMIQHKLILSRPLKDIEVGGTLVADTIAYIPQLSFADTSLLDLFDENPSIRQLFVYGVLKNQITPDIVQGGLSPTYALKFDAYLADCIADNNASADADDADRESFGFIGGVGF